MTIRRRGLRNVIARKSNHSLYVLFFLFLILAISPLTACAPRIAPPNVVNSATQSTGLAVVSLTFTADADAQVSEANPGTNYGNTTYLQVDGAADLAVESFVRFDVTGVSGPIQNAKLRVYVSSNASNSGPAVYATDTSWTESALTWTSRPARTSGVLDRKDNMSKDTWVDYDVTAHVQGNGEFSFVLAANNTDAATFSSRQGSQPPQLVIEVGGGQTQPATLAPSATPAATLTQVATTAAPETPASSASLTFIAEADARVKQSSPDTNYGSATTLQVDKDPDLESFLRFTVTGVSGPVQSARVRLYATDNDTSNGPAIYATDPAWDEKEITWNKRPARTSEAMDNKERIDKNTWVEYEVTSIVSGDGTYSFVLAGDSDNAVSFSSRQGVQPPQLVVTFGGQVTPTVTSIPTITPTMAEGSVSVIAAGDISTCENDNDQLTAQLLDSLPGTVLTLGDNVYDHGTLSEYKNCFDPTWGQYSDRIKPVPGNHEYLTSGASGYFQYFNNIPPYYAYDLGSWRIYALNSEIDVSASSEQVKWLEADLGANPRQCVLAYWHQPRWSSGKSHGGAEAYQTLWQILYEAGAELVLNGHEHNYERFAPMNATGQADPQGLREFVVGTGGRNHYDFGTIETTSEVRDNTSFGVLKLILRPTGYDWQFIPAAGSTFTDSGSTECH